MPGHRSRITRGVAIALGAVISMTFALTGSASAATHLGDPVPASLIVKSGSLEWVWASPCADGGCTSGLLVGKDGFGYATAAQWAKRPAISAFGVPNANGTQEGKCASAYFDPRYDHCDGLDPLAGFYGSAPSGGLPAGDNGTSPMIGYSETWLVRGASSTKRCADEYAAFAAAAADRDAAQADFDHAKAVETAARNAYLGDRTADNKAALDQATAARVAARDAFDAKKAVATSALAARTACLNPGGVQTAQRLSTGV